MKAHHLFLCTILLLIALTNAGTSAINRLQTRWNRPQPRFVTEERNASLIQQSSAAPRYRYTETFSNYQFKGPSSHLTWDTMAHQLTLEARDTLMAQSVSIVTGDTGQIFVVWQDLRSDSGDIYAQHLDTAGNRLWAHDQRVNSDDGKAAQSNPAAVVDSDGNLLVVWVDGRNRDDDLYAQKLKDNGDVIWLEDMRLNRESVGANQAVPAIARRGLFAPVVVWHDDRNGDYDIFAQAVEKNGLPTWQSDLRVNHDNSGQAQANPSVTMDSDGSVTIAWLDQRIGNRELYMQRLSSQGTPLWQNELRLNQPSEPALNRPALISLPNHEILVSWLNLRDERLSLQRVSTEGGLLWPQAVRVGASDQTIDPETSPGMMRLDDSAVLTWKSAQDGHLYAQRLDGKGNALWPSILRIDNPDSVATPGYQALQPAVIHSAPPNNQQLLFVWFAQRQNGQSGIYSRMVQADGALSGVGETRVNQALGRVDQRAASLALHQNGESSVVWQDHRHRLPALYLQRIDASGQLLWSEQIGINQERASSVTPTATNTAQLVADIAPAGDESVVVWADDRSGLSSIYLQRFDALGNQRWNHDQPVGHAQALGVAYFNPAIDASLKGHFIVWEALQNEQHSLMLQHVGSDGTPQWTSDQRVSEQTGKAHLPAIATDAKQTATLVWLLTQLDQTDVYAQRFDVEGNKLWPEAVRVNSLTGIVDQFNPPNVAMDVLGNATVVWVDRRQSGVYAQRIDATGKRQWASDLLLNTTPGTFSPAPDVSMFNNGDALIVWQEALAGRFTLFAQRVDATSKRLWQTDTALNVLVSPQIQQGQRPRLAVNPIGQSVLLWQEQRNQNPDVYLQSLDATGKRLWLDDRMVLRQDYFYVAQGSVQSTVIDQVDEAITQAVLTARWQGHAGKVGFWLSNNDGKEWVAVEPGLQHVFTTTGSALRWRVVLQAHPKRQSATPILQELQLEYSTEPKNNNAEDLYEPDDDCTLAAPLQLDGEPQQHRLLPTMNAAAVPQDWVKLATGGAQDYIVSVMPAVLAQETAQDAVIRSEIELMVELYKNCEPTATLYATAHGASVHLRFSSPGDTTYYVRIHPSISPSMSSSMGQSITNRISLSTSAPVAYQVSARRPVTEGIVTEGTVTEGIAILLAGQLSTQDPANRLVNQTSNRAYRALRQQGFSAERIYYLNPLAAQDVDGNGQLDDIDVLPSLNALENLLPDWMHNQAREGRNHVLFYLIGYNEPSEFKLTASESITVATLDRWLDNWEATNSLEQVVLIAESDYAGALLGVAESGSNNGSNSGNNNGTNIEGWQRTIIASTGVKDFAWPTAQGLLFSDILWLSMQQGYTIQQSYWRAQRQVAATGYDCRRHRLLCQTPWLSENGVTIPTAAEQVDSTPGWSLQLPYRSFAPWISDVQAETESATQSVQLSVRVATTQTLSQIEARILTEDYNPTLPAGYAFPAMEQPVVPLTLSQTITTGTIPIVTYVGILPASIHQKDTYLTLYAWDQANVPLLPYSIKVGWGCCIYLPIIRMQ